MADQTTTPSLGWQNKFSTTLTSGITSSDTAIPLNSIPTPSEGFLVIEPDSATNWEVIYYTSKSGSGVVCSSAASGRGIDDSTAVSHSAGATVRMDTTAGMFEALQGATALTGVHTNNSNYAFDFVSSGCVWTGDSYGGSLAASMTSGVVYINGRRHTVAAVTARAFTTNVDTYIDLLYSATDNVATPVYTTAATNAASPALAANSVRIGIIQAAATITAATKINQGQEDKVFPIASSIPYAVTDSLGNLICPRDPNRRIIGYRQIITDFTAATLTDITGLSLVCAPPAGRKLRISGFIGLGSCSVANNGVYMSLVNVNSGLTIAEVLGDTNTSGDTAAANPTAMQTPGTGTFTYKARINRGTNAATVHSNGSATNPNYIMVELV